MSENHLSDLRFDSLALHESVLAGIRDAGFEFCTPIQADTLPIALKPSDVAGQAQTGTGKTAAFLIAAYQRVLSNQAPVPINPFEIIVVDVIRAHCRGLSKGPNQPLVDIFLEVLDPIRGSKPLNGRNCTACDCLANGRAPVVVALAHGISSLPLDPLELSLFYVFAPLR